MFRQLSQCLQPSGLNSDFTIEGIPFNQYIQRMQGIISEARVDLRKANNIDIIKANSPCEHVPAQPPKHKYPYSLLLIHGLLDSPQILSSLFNHYKDKQLLVRSLLLPGHGTRPGDLLNIQLESWIKATRYAIDTCVAQSEKLIVLGFSLGASLAIHQALMKAPIDALILICPVLSLKSKLAYALSHWGKLVTRAHPRMQWFRACQEDDYAKYQSVPLNAINQSIRLCNKIHHLSKHEQITIPQFVALTEDDEVVAPQASVNYFKKQPNPKNKLLIYSNKPAQPHPKITYRASAYPDKKILNFSHVSLPVAPAHPHYGKNGDFFDLLHYRSPLGRLLPKAKLKPVYSGAINWHELINYPMSRLHYNPDFYHLTRMIDKFLYNSVNLKT